VAIATKAVNAQGNTIAAHLQDAPNHVREVAGHRVHEGATVTRAVVQTLSRNDLWTLHPVFPEGEVREYFEELIDNLGMFATPIGEEVSLDAVIGNVFVDE